MGGIGVQGVGVFGALAAPDPNAALSASSLVSYLIYDGSDTDPVSVTGCGFQPDMVTLNWTAFVDVETGEGFYIGGGSPGTFTTPMSFDVDGFTFNDFASSPWNVGSQTPHVQAFKKDPSYFDIVRYAGTGAPQDIAFDLDGTAELIIIQNVTSGGAVVMYHKSADAVPETGFMFLFDSTGFNIDPDVFDDTAPTASVFTVGASDYTNKIDDDFVAYVFKSNDFFNVFGYIGNNEVGTNEVDMGFKPYYTLIQGATPYFYPYAYIASRGASVLTEFSGYGGDLDFTDTGFVIQTDGSVSAPDATINGDGNVYVGFGMITRAQHGVAYKTFGSEVYPAYIYESGTFHFKVPYGITSLEYVDIWAAGGNGGDNTLLLAGGGGGSGGYSHKEEVAVTPGQNLALVIAAHTSGASNTFTGMTVTNGEFGQDGIDGGLGGDGGTATGGDVNNDGNPGSDAGSSGTGALGGVAPPNVYATPYSAAQWGLYYGEGGGYMAQKGFDEAAGGAGDGTEETVPEADHQGFGKPVVLSLRW